ncbi:MAG: (E)-4-hydroxy-3-methylbut-2-enyl-diphosphate synthase [Verrucomicrobia bacterium]|nr:(E)-4-hydroxy-3-methylbut-2-enyl-diphosphate synthase [Verrucomicrobiota bacterium]
MAKYSESIFKTKRWLTREVLVGSIGVGGQNPIRIQSMTTSKTHDVEATVEQIIRLSDAGCEIARVTVQGIKEAEACEAIKNSLLQRGYTIPLVADIHFYPPAAMRAVEFVDKIRINPGNYADKRASFKVLEYDDSSYAQELERIEEKFTPLVEKCKALKKAMRIGTNHGSLSDRIMNRYGDTPYGMVESALEFARICRKNDYHNFLFSMKASNPQVMIAAYRLLVKEMMALGWNYPLHLGVTEAGMGEDGRIKSAIGIGSLLLDGLGDTIRISLTEDPWKEIDPCKRLIAFTNSYYESKGVEPFEEKGRDIESIERRSTLLPTTMNLHRDGALILELTSEDLKEPDLYIKIGCEIQFGKPKRAITTADCLIVREKSTTTDELNNLSIATLLPSEIFVTDGSKESLSLIERERPDLIFLSPKSDRLHTARKFFTTLREKNIKTPVILYFSYNMAKEDLLIASATEFGALLSDGLGDGICLSAPYDVDFIRNLSLNILQASRRRTSKTEFISCPGCGRTLFDLQEVTKRIGSKTAHLPGVKIAIMGCIVNGPGEMADADFGYVGSKPGMIDLYIGKKCVEKDINFAEADDRLIALIKKEGRWLEPKEIEV